jgi:hypothetical protein
MRNMNDTHTRPTSRRRLRTSLLAVVAAAAMVAATLVSRDVGCVM